MQITEYIFRQTSFFKIRSRPPKCILVLTYLSEADPGPTALLAEAATVVVYQMIKTSEQAAAFPVTVQVQNTSITKHQSN
jgi:hypothetical protein